MSDLIHSTAPARAGAPPHPGLIVMHGLGDDEQGLLMLSSQLDPTTFAISVRAPFPYRWGGHMWFDLEGHGPGLGTPSIEHSLDAMSRFIDQAIAAYPIDPERLYIGGFSMGAAMAGAISLLHPDRIAGTVMISGFLPPDADDRYRLDEARDLPVFQAHGTADSVIDIQYARMTRDFLQGIPVDLTYREYPIGHTVTPEELADLSAWWGSVQGRTGPETPR